MTLRYFVCLTLPCTIISIVCITTQQSNTSDSSGGELDASTASDISKLT